MICIISCSDVHFKSISEISPTGRQATLLVSLEIPPVTGNKKFVKHNEQNKKTERQKG